MMRIILAGVLLLGMVGPAAAQDDDCDADPRWLVVTVVYSRIASGGEGFDTATGVRTVDRCDVDTMSEVDPDKENPILRRMWNAGARTELFGGDGPDTWSYWYYVRETIHDICAVLNDCADATEQRRAP